MKDVLQKKSIYFTFFIEYMKSLQSSVLYLMLKAIRVQESSNIFLPSTCNLKVSDCLEWLKFLIKSFNAVYVKGFGSLLTGSYKLLLLSSLYLWGRVSNVSGGEGTNNPGHYGTSHIADGLLFTIKPLP